jgi:hypothetical protein
MADGLAGNRGNPGNRMSRFRTTIAKGELSAYPSSALWRMDRPVPIREPSKGRYDPQ